MTDKTGGIRDWIIPFAFVFCAGWLVWHLPAFMLDFLPYEGANESTGIVIDGILSRNDVTPNLPGLFGGHTDIVDWATLIAAPILFYFGMRNLKHAVMEFPHYTRFDYFALFLGRVVMILIISMTAVMLIEVFLRYVVEKPTLWANELTLWIAGFVFLISGIYAMQQRTHIRIFLLYDVLPRWAQHTCDVISTFLICFFAAALVFGSYSQVFVNKLYKWQTFGTAFDPPIPAIIQPMVLIAVSLVALQAVMNLIADWHRDPSALIDKDVIDEEELAALKKSVGAK